MLTVETTKEQLEELTANSLVLFVPNKLSVGEIIISPGIHPKLYRFLNDYFYGYHNGCACYKPFAWAGLMLEEIEDEAFDDTELAEDGDMPPFASIHEYLRTVCENYGDDTIVICSFYQ